MSASLDQGPQPRAGALTIHRDHCETLDPRGLLTDGTVSEVEPEDIEPWRINVAAIGVTLTATR